MGSPQNELDEFEAIENARRELGELFGVEFSSWTLTDEWQPVKAESSPSPLRSEQLAANYAADHPSVSAFSQSESVVIIPVETTSAHNAVAAIVPNQPEGYWERLSRSAFQSIQKDRQLEKMESVLKELSESMEESTWMRGLFQSVQSCEATQTVAEVAQLMLPKLSALIQSRSVGYLPLDDRQSPVWTDRRNVPSLKKLFAEFPPRDDHRPVIFNAESEQDVQNVGLRSLIMAPVRFRGRDYGVVVAVDCRAHHLASSGIVKHLSEYEFGTKEATLVEAAAAMLATHCRNANLLQSKERLVVGVIQTLGGAVDARDPYTKGHSDRVALYAREIAREMGMDESECQRIHITGLLHDVGKIGIPDDVLKKPGKLTFEEYEIIKTHARQGYEILKELDDLAFTLPGVLHHHERIDGNGYPSGLAADDIPLAARILAVADAYDAMTSSRAYRKCMSFEKAEQIVRENIGSQFDPQAAAAFLRILPKIHEIADSDARRRLPEEEGNEKAPQLAVPMSLEIDSAIVSVLES